MTTEQMFKQLLNEIRGMKGEYKDLKDDVTDLKEDVTGLKEDILGIKEDVIGLKKDVVGLKEDVTTLQENNQSIKSQLEENTQLTKAILHRQEETDAKLENLSMDMHIMRGELSSLKEGQERQDKILESLALRSLEQETELRELKRIK